MIHNQLLTKFTFSSRFLSITETEQIKCLLSHVLTPKLPLSKILKDISSEFAISKLRNILKEQCNATNNIHLLRIIVGQSLDSFRYPNIVKYCLKWETVLLSACISNNYLLVEYVLKNKNHEILKIEEALIASCEAGSDVEIISLWLEVFDFDPSHIITGFNLLS